MLPRVTIALQKYVTPVSTRRGVGLASPTGERDPGSSGGFERQSKEKLPQGGHPSVHLRIIPASGPGGSAETPIPSSAAPGSVPSVATAFLDLFQLVRRQRLSLVRWSGIDRYRAAMRSFARTLKVHKGAMLDQKAE